MEQMRFKHTDRPGFLFGIIDFLTAGLFFLFYMPLSGLQDELDYILGRRTQRYWVAYLLGIPTLFIYPLIWMARIAEELKAKAIELGVDGPYTSWWHMFGWNTLGVLFLGPGIATGRFFSTLNKVERKIDSNNYMENEMKFCQSCGMPLTEELLGTNADGSKNEDYCIYCYKDGKFTMDCTMDQMIEQCAQFVDEVNKNLPKPITKEEYIAQMKMYFPQLKRWR